MIVLGLVLLLVLLVLSIPATKWVRRRLALARSSDARGRVLAAYAVLSQRAADLGWGRRPAETLVEYRARLKQGLSLNGDLDRLTDLAGRAAYSEANLSPEAAEEARNSARRLSRDIRRTAGFTRSLTGWFRFELPSRG